MKLGILAAQINVKTGDIDGNTDRVIGVLEKAIPKGDAPGYHFIVFPEMTISGYNCGDLFEKEYFINHCGRAIARIQEYSTNLPNTVILVGCPTFAYKSRGFSSEALHNSAFVIMNGIVVGVYHKQLLANDYHHEDRKYFVSGDQNKVFYVHGVKFGILICQDGWKSEGRNIQAEMADEGAELFFSMNYSYYTFGKVEVRENVFKHDKHPMLYVNNVGIGDITKNFICYDGCSFVYNPYGEKFAYPVNVLFNEKVFVVEYDTKSRRMEIVDHYGVLTPSEVATYKSKNPTLLSALLYSQKKIFDECHVKNAQVHISGGVDSAIVGYIVATAMGPGNTIFITQPSKNNGEVTLGNAKKLSDNLNIELQYDYIIEYVETYKKNNPNASKAQIASFEATIRKASGVSLTHYHKSALVSCGNHTENSLSWFSLGDIGNFCGIYQPVGDLSKTEIFDLCRYINEVYEGREVIPASLYDGSVKPAAELEDSSVDPFNYILMSHICEMLVRYQYSPEKLITHMMINMKYRDYGADVIRENVYEAFRRIKMGAFKRAQSSPVLILSNRSFGFSMRDPILNHHKYSEK